jgi:hypothetical protein
MRQHTTMLEPDWSLTFGKVPEIEVRFLQESGGHLYVLGISHSDIRVGDRLRSVYRYAPGSMDDRQQLATLSLKVASIAAFHNHLNRVPANMTAALLLSGDYAPLLHLVERLNWVDTYGSYHQWSERVATMPRLTLSQ